MLRRNPSTVEWLVSQRQIYEWLFVRGGRTDGRSIGGVGKCDFRELLMAPNVSLVLTK
ncbi:hypothetical protein OF83DRAFT_1127333 [Amylostereum chailletii]|nr:hypothetical protein OF83DRAFT_1127333 [Amylostereum chailletii]